VKAGPDVLLVGPLADADRQALGDAGLTAEIVESCLQAILRLEQVPSPLVVLSSRTLEGRDEAAVRALRDTTGHPRVLLTVPPDRVPIPSDSRMPGIEEFLPEPYFPEDLVARVEQILADAATPPEIPAENSGEALTTWLTDLAQLHGSVDNLTHVSENIAALFERQGRAESASVYLPSTPGAPLALTATTGPRSRTRLSVTGFEEGTAGEAIRSGRVVADDRVLALPLPLRDSGHGLILLAGPRHESRFSLKDGERLAPLTEQSAHAVMTALKIRHLTDLSTIDDLTGLYNQRSFRQSLVKEFRRAERYERPLSLALIDLDKFKIFNDENGHEAGNRCLKQLGEIMQSGFRDTDVVCRYGGEEFAIILPEVTRGRPGDGPGAWQVLERLRARIEAAPFPGEEKLPQKTVTISCGIAAYPEDARDSDSLVEAADQALYAAKRSGRNRVCVPGEPAPPSP